MHRGAYRVGLPIGIKPWSQCSSGCILEEFALHLNKVENKPRHDSVDWKLCSVDWTWNPRVSRHDSVDWKTLHSRLKLETESFLNLENFHVQGQSTEILCSVDWTCCLSPICLFGLKFQFKSIRDNPICCYHLLWLWWLFLGIFEYPFRWILYRFRWILFTSSYVNFCDWLFLQSYSWFVTLKI